MIREIFNAITPENIKANPLFSTIIDAFLTELEDSSKYSIDINNIFKTDNKIIKLQFIKMYLNSFYEIMKEVQSSNLVGDVFFNNSNDIVPDFTKILDIEYFTTSKNFKENKGTRVAIEYVYKLIERMNTGALPSYTPFKLEETQGTIFHFNVEGNLTAEVYENTVKPLAHPVGFAYVYSQVMSDLIHDFFRVLVSYKDVVLKINCINSDDAYDFIEEGYIVQDIQEGFLNNKKYLRVVFSDGTSLLKTTDGTFVYIVHYGVLSDPQDFTSGEIIKNFTSDQSGAQVFCAVQLEYTPDYNSLVDDSMVSELEDNSLIDDFWTDIDNIIRIGRDMEVGGFKIGQGVTKFIKETVSELVNFYPTLGNYDYYVPNSNLPTIGDFIISSDGFIKIGESTGFIQIDNDTDEYYDMRLSVSEDFLAEELPAPIEIPGGYVTPSA